MPRTPADATRFTATGPHAHSKTTATTIDLGAAPPPNETPAQKVARLREASRRAKVSQESTWDRVVSRGRIWADRAHKITATALIATSGEYLISNVHGGHAVQLAGIRVLARS